MSLGALDLSKACSLQILAMLVFMLQCCNLCA